MRMLTPETKFSARSAFCVGLLHAELKLPSPINQNDTLHVVFPGKNEPLNGKKLVRGGRLGCEVRWQVDNGRT